MDTRANEDDVQVANFLRSGKKTLLECSGRRRNGNGCDKEWISGKQLGDCRARRQGKGSRWEECSMVILWYLAEPAGSVRKYGQRTIW